MISQLQVRVQNIKAMRSPMASIPCVFHELFYHTEREKRNHRMEKKP